MKDHIEAATEEDAEDYSIPRELLVGIDNILSAASEDEWNVNGTKAKILYAQFQEHFRYEDFQRL